MVEETPSEFTEYGPKWSYYEMGPERERERDREHGSVGAF